MSEEWRPCFDGYYEVSNLGRVRRAKRAKAANVGYILKTRSVTAWSIVARRHWKHIP